MSKGKFLKGLKEALEGEVSGAEIRMRFECCMYSRVNIRKSALLRLI